MESCSSSDHDSSNATQATDNFSHQKQSHLVYKSHNKTGSNFDGNERDADDAVLDWETWKRDVPFWKHAISGSCAGVVEHCVLFPLDTLKTRVQALWASNKVNMKTSLRQLTADIYAQAGVKGFFRGLGAICLGCVPAHAALFSVFEASKARFGTESPLTSACCGGLATFAHDFILTPTDVVKQRLQLGCYKGTADCIRTILKEEGPIAFYRSISTTFAMNIPFGAIFVMTNEGIKRFFFSSKEILDQKRSPTTLPFYFLSAGIAGGIAGVVTTPMDVVKTRLQTQEMLNHSRFIPTFNMILKEEGVVGLWKGALARFALSIPSAAVCWGTYETVKFILCHSSEA